MNVFDAVKSLRDAHGDLDGRDLIAAVAAAYPERTAVISSFGAEAAVLLDLVSQVDRSLPVFFIDTGELFDETHEYRETLTHKLGLNDLRIVRPDPADLAAADELWRTDADACCRLRKVQPFERVRTGFDVLIDGRKRVHGGGRENLHSIEAGEDGVIKVSPLATWTSDRIESAFEDRDLPRHPLVEKGFRSIGCWPCTRAVAPGEPIRAGRWAGTAKSECGIHRLLIPDAVI
ncbi:MAG TPA: phosphoadenylyl-sulfate reductase [Magnetospirillaceae bacterium]|jgi:phosphoadenosine phosphosulfate reductase